MTLRDLDWLPSFTIDQLPPAPSGGHAHFWERAMSRRTLLGSVAVGAGALAASSTLRPLAAWAGKTADPRPIPGGIVAGGQGWHVSGPGYNAPGDPSSGLAEQSTITDFNGYVASAIVRGTGTGRQGGVVTQFPFDSDMRFMKGRYVGVDGRIHTGTFGFI
jgi:hypothetical protein